MVSKQVHKLMTYPQRSHFITMSHQKDHDLKDIDVYSSQGEESESKSEKLSTIKKEYVHHCEG